MNLSAIRKNAKPTIWGAILGATALAIFGFNWGGWNTSGASHQMAEAAVVSELVPICVGQYNADSQKVMKLAEMIEAGKWKQADYVATAGWATMPGSDEANKDVAKDCAIALALAS